MGELKRCENCKKPMRQKVFIGGRREYPSDYKKRRYCSRICAAICTAAERKVDAAAHERG